MRDDLARTIARLCHMHGSRIHFIVWIILSHQRFVVGGSLPLCIECNNRECHRFGWIVLLERSTKSIGQNVARISTSRHGSVPWIVGVDATGGVSTHPWSGPATHFAHVVPILEHHMVLLELHPLRPGSHFRIHPATMGRCNVKLRQQRWVGPSL